MRRLITILVLSIISMQVNAQYYEKVSGYLGKRIVLGVGADLSLSNQPQKQRNDIGSEDYRTSINKTLFMDGQYVLGNFFNLGARMGFNSTSAIISDEDEAGNSLSWTDYDPEGSLRYNRLVFVEGTPEIKDFYYGVYGKWFMKNKASLAPIGPYLTLGLNWHNYKFDFSNIRYYAFSEDPFGDGALTEFRFANGDGSAKYTELLMELGKATPLSERLLLDLSVKAAWLFTGSVSTNDIDAIDSPIESTKMQIRTRLRQMYYLNYTVKLSILL